MNVNVLPRDIYEELSSQEQITPQELWFVTSADTVVVDIDKIAASRDWTPEISSLSTDIDVLSAQLSAYVNLSGTYEDDTTFSYDFVVKEGNA